MNKTAQSYLDASLKTIRRVGWLPFTVKFNSPLPQQTVKQKIPFPWVLKLGGDMVAGGASSFYYDRRSSRHLKFDLPVSFAKYEESILQGNS